MISHLKRLSKASLSYASFPVISNLVAIFLLPLYTRFLSPEDYGTVEGMRVFASILFPFFGLGLGSAVLRCYFDYEDGNEKKRYLGSIRSFSLISTVVITAILIVLPKGVYSGIFPGIDFFPIIFLVIIGASLRVIATLSMSIMRAREEPLRYVLVQAFELLSNVGFSILFVVSYKRGAIGKVEANFLSIMILLIAAYLFTRKYYKWAFDWKAIKESLYIGIPLVPHSLANWGLGMCNRIILLNLMGLTQLGLYSLGHKIGGLIQMLVLSFNAAWAPFMFSLCKKEKEPEKLISRMTTYYFIVVISMALLISVFAEEAVSVMAAESYKSSYIVTPVVAFSYVFYGAYLMLTTQLFYKKNTKVLPVLTAIAAIVNIALNFTLIPLMGISGAALASLISYIVYAVITYYFSSKVFPIEYEFRRLGIIFISALGCYALSTLIRYGIFLNIIIKSIIVAAFPVLLYSLKFFSIQEISWLKKIFESLKGKG